MKTMRSTDDLQRIYANVYANINLPEIDVSGKVMDRITAKKNSRQKGAYKRKAAVVLAVSFVLLFTSFTAIWAVTTGQTPGELAGMLIARYRQTFLAFYNTATSQSGQQIHTSEAASWAEILQYLEPGQGIAIQGPNEENKDAVKVIKVIKPVFYSSIADLKENAGFDFKTPSKLPYGYDFKSGNIAYWLPDTSVKNAEEELEVTIVESTDTVFYVSARYYGSDMVNSIWCHILRSYGDYSYTSKLKNAERLEDIEGMEAYYVINGDFREVLVIEKLEKPVNDPNNADPVFDRIAYTIGSYSKDITRETLLEMAKSLR